MNIKRINEISEKLNGIWMQPFDFNGIHIAINYAARAKHAKNWVIAPHYHPWFELNYVSKGSLYTTIDGYEFLINEGESYMIPPGILHSHRHNKVGDDGICIRFSLNSDAENPIVAALSVPVKAPFRSGIENMDISGGFYGIQAAFISWLVRLFETQNNAVLPANTAKNAFSAQVILYLEEYYQRKIKVSDIANTLNTSYRTLARRFLNETGMTISEKLTQIRIKHAKQLLLTTKLPLYDIAAATGFENEFYFSKVFKQKENITPKTYRRNHP